MKTVMIAMGLSVVLLLSVSQMAAAFGPQDPTTTAIAVRDSAASLPVWGYGVLGINLLIAGLLAAFPFLVKNR